MNDQTLILVDENDKFLGYAGRGECHEGRGRRHRAFVTLLFEKGTKRVLIQRRKHILFDGLWDLTAISHPLHFDKGSKGLKSVKGNKGKDETYQEASDRALLKEMGIRHVEIKKVGGFCYTAREGKNCENEYCAVLIGTFNGKFKANPNEVYEAKWVNLTDLINDIDKNPKKYAIWAREGIRVLKTQNPINFLGDLGDFVELFRIYYKGYFAKKRKISLKYPQLVSKFYRELEDFGSSGKAMRPYFVWLGFKIARKDANRITDLRRIMPVSLAVELVHSFFLIHDDVIDQSDVRRGKPTIHKRFEKDYGKNYGVNQAIILGDLALLEAFELLEEIDFKGTVGKRLKLKMLETLIETGYGEGLDVEFTHKKASFEQVEKVLDLKTARYSFVGPLVLGAIMAGAGAKVIGATTQYGIYCGKAFQLRDDILGVFGDERVMGKSALSDMQEGKNTILAYKTKEMATQSQRQQIDKIWGNEKAGRNDLKIMQSIMEDCGALNWCEQELSRYVTRAKLQSKKVTGNPGLRVILDECADFVANRQS